MADKPAHGSERPHGAGSDELRAARQAGDADAPLVLLHGFGGSSRSWAPVRALLGDDIDVIAVDLPGHGGSLHVEGRGGGAGRFAKSLLAMLSALNLPRVHLCGHSLGGATAALMALREPSRIASLTLVAPGGMSPAIDAHLLERYARASDFEAIAACLAAMTAPGYRWSDTAIAAMAAERARPGAVEALAQTFASMFPEGPAAGQGVIPSDPLAKLPMPVELLWGEHDRTVPRPERLPDGFVLTLVEGAGHMLPEEAPAAVARALVHQVKG